MTTPFSSAAARLTPAPRVQVRYRPLRHYLAALPAAQQQVRLTVADLEALLGPSTVNAPGAMPSWSAFRITQAFRHGVDFSAKLDRRDGAITFTRQPHQSLASRPPQEA